jgi:hypothetical protein
MPGPADHRLTRRAGREPCGGNRVGSAPHAQAMDMGCATTTMSQEICQPLANLP